MVKDNRIEMPSTGSRNDDGRNSDGRDGACSVLTNYKQTEIGLIPEDWEVRKLGTICTDLIQGINTAIDKPEYSINGVPILKANDIIDGRINVNECDYISQRSFARYNQRFYIRKGDFLLSNIGARLGTGSIYNFDLPSTYAWNVMRISVDTNFLNQQYFAHFINSPIFNKTMLSNQSGSGMGFVPKSTLINFLIIVPPFPEQEGIATALSDCDSWIDSIEEVLAKKRFIKQGAMQKLLTPKEDWEVKKLGEVLQFGSGRDYKHLKSGSIPVYGTGGIMTYVNHHLYDGESVGIGRKGTIDKPVFLQGKFWTVDTLFFTHSFNGVIPKYIFYQFLLIAWKEYNEASGVPSLNKNTLEQIEIQLPSLSEQTRIATILSDMDLEIEALEEKLGKARQIKQGMMQELLTGRVRLV